LITAAFGLGLGALAIWGLAALPTGFIPIEDQGYVIAGVQLPEGASLERTERVMDRITTIARGTPGVKHAVAIGGISVLDNNASLANAGATYVVLKDWRERGRGEDLRSLYPKLADELSKLEEGVGFVLVPPPIQGVGNAAGFQMELELRDDSFDFEKLQNVGRAIAENGSTQSGIERIMSPFRAGAPSCTWRSTASRPRRSACRSATSSRRFRPIWDRPTSTSSTGSATPSRSTPRPIINGARRRRRSAGCTYATPMATWCRSAP
jgi:HAE1 family hydrophobic/amphiphilic exporter-1